MNGNVGRSVVMVRDFCWVADGYFNIVDVVVEGVVDELYGCSVDSHECRQAVIDEMPDMCRGKRLMQVMSQWWGVVGEL